jgi:cation:H+ antiporter
VIGLLVVGAVGLVAMVRGADQFVLGSARLAGLLRVPPVVIGALVLGFGTSLPELFVSGMAALAGERDLAVGNIVGSNAANITLVLGVAATLTAVRIASRTVRRELPISAAAVGLFAVLTWDGLARWRGVVLLVGFAIALGALLRDRGDVSEQELGEELEAFLGGATRRTRWVEAVRVGLGLVATLVGAHLVKESALDIAAEVGLSEGFVGLTLVALGTSLPELVTAVVGARRGEDELVVGDLLGSNVFNSLAIGGAIHLLGPGPLAEVDLAHLAVVVMLGTTGLCWFFMGRRLEIGRWEAITLIAVYLAALPLLAR